MIGRIGKWRGLACISALALPVPACATTQSNMALVHLGAQGNLAYVNFTTILTDTCSWGNLYMDLATDAGRAAYSMLLTARASGKALSRVDYHSSAGTCFVDLVEF